MKRLSILPLTLLAGCVTVPLASFETGLPTVPGAFDPAVTQDSINQTICVSGWSKTRRPPVSYTNKIKFALMAAAGVPRANASQYELDHDASIGLGGSPTSPQNLWLQPNFGPHNAHHKDALESRLHNLVCAGILPLAQAQHEITADWIASGRAYVGASVIGGTDE